MRTPRTTSSRTSRSRRCSRIGRRTRASPSRTGSRRSCRCKSRRRRGVACKACTRSSRTKRSTCCSRRSRCTHGSRRRTRGAVVRVVVGGGVRGRVVRGGGRPSPRLQKERPPRRRPGEGSPRPRASRRCRGSSRRPTRERAVGRSVRDPFGRVGEVTDHRGASGREAREREGGEEERPCEGASHGERVPALLAIAHSAHSPPVHLRQPTRRRLTQSSEVA